jgi:hypothetical protein
MYNSTKMIRVHTRELQNPGILKRYMTLGFRHIRRVICLNRFPTIGTLSEISYRPLEGSFPIDSPEGRRLIGKMAYI